MFRNDTSTKQISAKLSDLETANAKLYIKGAVHSFCENNKGEDFSVRILFGGDNRNWYDTPIQKIYDYYEVNQYSDSARRAAIDVGRLLKAVLSEDKSRTYDKVDGYTNSYRLKHIIL